MAKRKRNLVGTRGRDVVIEIEYVADDRNIRYSQETLQLYLNLPFVLWVSGPSNGVTY